MKKLHYLKKYNIDNYNLKKHAVLSMFLTGLLIDLTKTMIHSYI